VPSSNSVMEVDFYRKCPASVAVHTARMFMEDTTPEGESRMLDEFTTPAAEAVATVHPHVIVFGCTSAGALRGNEFDAQLCGRLSDQFGVPVVSTIRAVRRAISRRKATRIGIITPYVDSLNGKIAMSLQGDGLEVVGIEGLGISENFAIAAVTPDEIADFAERSFAGANIDLLFASCTNFRALEAVKNIEQQVGVPAMTSNLAALEETFTTLRIDEDVVSADEALTGARGLAPS
jgi:maleate isomerase